jgi:hypothetical protein
MENIYEELTVIDDSGEESPVDDTDEKYGQLNLDDYPDDDGELQPVEGLADELFETADLQRSPFDIYIKFKRMTLFKIHEFTVRINPKQPIANQIQFAKKELEFQIEKEGFNYSIHELRATLRTFFFDHNLEQDTILYYKCEFYKPYQN